MASKSEGPHTLTDVAPSSVTAVLTDPTSKLDQETGICRSSRRIAHGNGLTAEQYQWVKVPK
jgi:hypothetical protein